MTFTRAASLAILFHSVAFTSALAADWDSDTTRLLGDPSFLPLAGQIEGSFGSTYFIDRYDVESEPAAFGGERSYRRTGFSFLPELNYGITDDISVFATLDWGNSFNREEYTYERFVLGTVPQPPGLHIVPIPGFHYVLTHATADFHALGADDPAFGATWRVIDQRYAPVSVDITGTYSPDIFQSRGSSTLQTGTLATGGQNGTVEGSISREMVLLTLRAYGTFGYEGRRNERDPFNEDLRSAPHATYAAGLQTELRMTPWLALHAGVSAQQAMSLDQELIYGQGPSTQVSVHPSGSISPYGGILIPLFGRRLVAQLDYQHDFVNNETRQFPFSEDRFFKQESDQVTGRLRLLFGGPSAALPAAPVAAPPRQTGPLACCGGDYTYIVFFDWDRADLSARARAIVAAAAQGVSRQNSTRIEVQGYTDLSGTVAYNYRLSLRRARSVQAELVRDGVSAGEIGIHGYGESNPLVPTAAGVREPQNRRVEIILR